MQTGYHNALGSFTSIKKFETRKVRFRFEVTVLETGSVSQSPKTK